MQSVNADAIDVAADNMSLLAMPSRNVVQWQCRSVCECRMQVKRVPHARLARALSGEGFGCEGTSGGPKLSNYGLRLEERQRDGIA